MNSLLSVFKKSNNKTFWRIYIFSHLLLLALFAATTAREVLSVKRILTIAAGDSVLALEQNLNEFEPQKKLGETVNNIAISTNLAIRLNLDIGSKRVAEVFTPGRNYFEVHFSNHFKSPSGENVKIEFYIDLTSQVIMWIGIILGTSLVITWWSFYTRSLQRKDLMDIGQQINLISHEVKKTSEALGPGEEVPRIRWSKFNILELYELSQMIDKFVQAIQNMRGMIIQYQVAEEKRKIASQVAHDIRSPLSALMFFKNKTENEPLSGDELLLLKSAINRIENIASNILREHRASRTQDISTFAIGSTIQDLIREKKVIWGNVKFHFSDQTNQKTISGSRSDFLRALSNILNNSYEAQNPARELEISINCSGSADSFEIIVQDNGLGMPPEVQSEIFKNEIQSKKSDGTGLGLITSSELLKKNNMCISLISSNSNGTTFRIAGQW